MMCCEHTALACGSFQYHPPPFSIVMFDSCCACVWGCAPSACGEEAGGPRCGPQHRYRVVAPQLWRVAAQQQRIVVTPRPRHNRCLPAKWWARETIGPLPHCPRWWQATRRRGQGSRWAPSSDPTCSWGRIDKHTWWCCLTKIGRQSAVLCGWKRCTPDRTKT